MNNDDVSYFADYINGMLDARDTLGYTREPHAATLHSFDKYCSVYQPDWIEIKKSYPEF